MVPPGANDDARRCPQQPNEQEQHRRVNYIEKRQGGFSYWHQGQLWAERR
jgi:hypothetical protein